MTDLHTPFPINAQAPRLIPDANVILNGFAGGDATLLTTLYTRFRRAEVRFVVSAELLAELGTILSYPLVQRLRGGISAALAFRVAVDLLTLGEFVNPVPRLSWPSLSDPKDWFLLDLLYESGADALVTQDRTVIRAGQELGMPVIHPSQLRQRGFL